MEKAFIIYDCFEFVNFSGYRVEIYNREENNIIIFPSDDNEIKLSFDKEFIEYIYSGNIKTLMNISQNDIDKDLKKREYGSEEGEHVEMIFRNGIEENILQ